MKPLQILLRYLIGALGLGLGFGIYIVTNEFQFVQNYSQSEQGAFWVPIVYAVISIGFALIGAEIADKIYKNKIESKSRQAVTTSDLEQ